MSKPKLKPLREHLHVTVAPETKEMLKSIKQDTNEKSEGTTIDTAIKYYHARVQRLKK